MTAFTGFTADDFAGLRLPGFAERMAFIKDGLRPKLEALGQELAPFLTELTGQPIYPITAKHMRRKVNPPDDTWVAWSANKRGYKMLPHFQVGLWHTHAFIQAGVIYEASAKAAFGARLLESGQALAASLPAGYRWLEDYVRPDGIGNGQMTAHDFARIATRLMTRKEADCMVGLSVPAAEAAGLGAGFAGLAREVMERLLPVYRLGM
ncbi:MAG: hypothetical protein K0R39_3426 [Symbiobacteriaceae bacterium]|jgi:uncharacterized protein YktB (UPF0637 family)|nr:hypothetical protein [Symbiobacteriaceae bacterium]